MNRILKFFDPYIALMIATVGLAALLPAQGEGAVVAKYAATAGIVFLFFLYGARLSPRAALDGMLQWRLHIAVLLCSFVLFPVLGLAFKPVLIAAVPAALVTGFLFLCAMPSTVQSSIAFTSIARGNVPAALCAASASNILGVLLSPLLVGWLLKTQGVTMSLAIFRDITLQLLVPFIAGQLLRPWIGEWVQRQKAMLTYADRGSILLIIYVAFSQGMVAGIWSRITPEHMLVLVTALCALLAIVLVITAQIGRRVMHLSRENRIVLQFCGSKKSLASGLPIAMVIFSGQDLGMIVLPLMLFHQLQLIVCAILARAYSRDALSEPACQAQAPAEIRS